ncbi:hypothetical protein [Pseudolabrys taiwanensis]|uniref:hypothetical protein n=1 Tax=Pseudolabrys taiwanensis TaxID=331696 RepID=UPI0013B421F7|nr:hypothetical protein [Pseudolabrys taiwanensis]
MKALVTALALVTLASSTALAAAPHHYRRRAPERAAPQYYHPGRLVPLLVSPGQGPRPAGTTWHDHARYGELPYPTGTWARSQDGERYQRVDSYDVVLNGQIVGRDPDPNIRFQLLREAGFPPP